MKSSSQTAVDLHQSLTKTLTSPRAAGDFSVPIVSVSVPSDDDFAMATDISSGPAATESLDGINNNRNKQTRANQSPLTNEDDELNHDGNYEDFSDLELGTDQVPLGEILDKLDAEHAAGKIEGFSPPGFGSNFIRLHAVTSCSSPTISATVNVATLDLSDPESIHQHLSELNDTVLKVSTASSTVTKHVKTISQSLQMPTSMTASSISSNMVSSSPAQYNISPSLQTSSHSLVPSSMNCLSVASSSTLSSPPSQHATVCSSQQPAISSSPSSSPITPISVSLTTSTISTSSNGVASSRRSHGGSSSSKSNPQLCPICSKTFSNASALAKHRLTHSEERRYQCTTCGKAFKRQDHLNGHLLTHRSTKPFACTVDGCNKSYCDARSLRRHKENHHGSGSNTKQATLIKANPGLNNEEGANSTTPKSLGIGVNSEKNQDKEQVAIGKQIQQGLVVNTKGLSPHHAQFIEELLKDSPTTKVSSTTSVQTNFAQSSSFSKKIDGSNNVSEALPALVVTTNSNISQISKKEIEEVTPSVEKPVECTMCNRRFKNIPALNGHMRLHGGYYKKDADGKRINSSTDKITKERNMQESSSVQESESQQSRKRRKDTNETFLVLAEPPCKVLNRSFSSPVMPSETNTFSSPKSVTLKASQQTTPQETCMAFKYLPPPDTSQLLANLEKQKNLSPNSCVQQSLGNFTNLPFDRQDIQLPTVPVPPTMDLNSSLSTACKQHVVHGDSEGLFKSSHQLLKVDTASDKSPKIGLDHQADIPELIRNFSPVDEGKEESLLIWDPKTASRLNDEAFGSYLKLASSCLVGGGSKNEEIALAILQENDGNVQQALIQLMTKSESHSWNVEEVNLFYEGLVKHQKDFVKISQNLGTRTVKECVEFYYWWKSVCREEWQSFKAIFASTNNSTETCPTSPESKNLDFIPSFSAPPSSNTSVLSEV